MRLDPNPLFRKAIIPWYDSTLACWILLVCMIVLALFSWAGIDLALSVPFYRRLAWVPWLLLVLSFVAGASVAFRLGRRYYLNNFQMRDL